MKKINLAFLLFTVTILLGACAGASTMSPVGVNCLTGIPVQDKNPDCTGGG
ncbi:hypothetical protein [Polynucleobacter alcilacus]|uniref:hypothetical protein n=1 Tax=Polynucleobacter alcilacus TaxID=1819739 RepID=UPI001C0E894B|nr:hypothetical protein [Polynucleobacter alcilacus]MBU3567819.1 hypothetical protein [Polynucleobacter alcilacus]